MTRLLAILALLALSCAAHVEPEPAPECDDGLYYCAEFDVCLNDAQMRYCRQQSGGDQ